MATWICNERHLAQRMRVAPATLLFGLRHPSDLFGGWRVSFPGLLPVQKMMNPGRFGARGFFVSQCVSRVQRPDFEPGTGATLQKNSFTGVAPIVRRPAACAARICWSFVYWTGVTPGAQVTT